MTDEEVDRTFGGSRELDRTQRAHLVAGSSSFVKAEETTAQRFSALQASDEAVFLQF